MIELKNVSKSYIQGDSVVHVLKKVSVSIEEGEQVAIVGASGAGKSTLLSLMAAMDEPDEGEIWINGKRLKSLSAKQLADFRNQEMAIIFQSFELVPSFNALENVMLPLDIRGVKAKTIAQKALKEVGLSHRLHHLPSMLSGGEEQRVAIARALAQGPKILFADEPTGNLDPQTGTQILSLLKASTGGQKRTLVIITHDREIAKTMDRVLEIKDGLLQPLNL